MDRAKSIRFDDQKVRIWPKEIGIARVHKGLLSTKKNLAYIFEVSRDFMHSKYA